MRGCRCRWSERCARSWTECPRIPGLAAAEMTSWRWASRWRRQSSRWQVSRLGCCWVLGALGGQLWPVPYLRRPRQPVAGLRPRRCRRRPRPHLQPHLIFIPAITLILTLTLILILTLVLFVLVVLVVTTSRCHLFPIIVLYNNVADNLVILRRRSLRRQ